MFVFKKPEDLLFQNKEVISTIILCQILEPDCSFAQEPFSWGILNQVAHCVNMFKRDMQNFIWFATALDLVFEAHEHKVKQFLHGGCVELHDRTVGESFEDFFAALNSVHSLGAEELIYKFWSKHAFDDVLEYFLRSLSIDVLRPESLLEDVYHLTT